MDLLGGKSRELGAHRGKALAGRVTAGKPARLQRLDVGLDLDLGPELLAHRRFEAVRDLVRARECQAAVDFEVERHRQPAAD